MSNIDICVIGMPRSGTSFTANFLNKMGIYFGDEDDGIEDIYPKHLNPDGYLLYFE